MAETYAEYSQRMAHEYATRLLAKPFATAQELAMYRPISFGRSEIEIGEETFKLLDSEEEMDNLDATERAMADRNVGGVFWDSANDTPLGFGSLPSTVDHRNNQTPIRDQKDRGTCVCFASLAALETLIKLQQNVELDLSEQFANWVFMAAQGVNQCNDGLRATLAARYLSVRGVCEESDLPYEDKTTVRAHCNSQPSQQAMDRARFGVGEFTIIDGPGLFGPSIKNTDFLESILSGGNDAAQARDIVFGTEVAWGKPDANHVFDVVRDAHGNPLQSVGGHAMLIVGYDKTPQIPFFIMKNSWGTEVKGEPVGVGGYYYVSYDYVRTYGKYGYAVNSLRTDMPTG